MNKCIITDLCDEIKRAIKCNDRDMLNKSVQQLEEDVCRAAHSTSISNWRRKFLLEKTSNVQKEKRLARLACQECSDKADATQYASWLPEVPTCSGIHGRNKGRRIDIVIRENSSLCFVELKVNRRAGTLERAFAELIVYTTMFRLAQKNRERFGKGNMDLLDAANINWKIIAPLNYLRKQDAVRGNLSVLSSVRMHLSVGSVQIGLMTLPEAQLAKELETLNDKKRAYALISDLKTEDIKA